MAVLLLHHLRVVGSIPASGTFFQIEGNVCSKFKSWKMQSQSKYRNTKKIQKYERKLHREISLVYLCFEDNQE